MTVEFTAPVRLQSPNAIRGHWGKRARQVKSEHASIAGSAMIAYRQGRMPAGVTLAWQIDGVCLLGLAPPFRVTITRIGKRPMDMDNLVAASKAVIDCLAAMLGVDDNPSAPVDWRFAQESGGYAVRVRIESNPAWPRP